MTSLGSNIEFVGVTNGDNGDKFEDALRRSGRRDAILKAKNPQLVLSLQGFYDGPVIVTSTKEEQFIARANKKRISLGKCEITMIKDFEVCSDSSYCEFMSVVPGTSISRNDETWAETGPGTVLSVSKATSPTIGSPGFAALPRDMLVVDGMEPPCLIDGSNRRTPKAGLPDGYGAVHPALSGPVLEDMWNEVRVTKGTGELNSHVELKDCMKLLQDSFKKGGYSADAHGLKVRAADLRIILQKMGVCLRDDPTLATVGIRQCWAQMLNSMKDDNKIRFRVSLHEMLFLLTKVSGKKEDT